MSISDLTEAFRKAMVDVLVPELKELKTEMNERFVDLKTEMDKRFDSNQQQILSMQQQMMKMQNIQERILDKMEVNERMTKVEALVEQLFKKAA